MALLYSNSGKLMRLCAQVYGNSTKLNPDEDRGQFTQQEETYFKKAFEFYNKALGLVQDEASSDVKHSLMLELTGAYFSMGSIMQDNAPLQLMAEENVVKRISSAFVKSLHYVEIIPFNETNKTLIANQIGNIHHKLASLYHHVLRNQISEYGKKNYRSLAELHYNKVYNALDPKHFPVKTLQVIMEHLAFYDYLLSQGTSPKWLKSKHEILFKQNNDLRKALQELSIRSQNDSLTDKEEVTKMVKWLYGQFSSTLKETIKCISGKQHKNISLIDIKQAKQMFEKIIREKLSDELSEKLAKTNILLENLQDIYEKK